MFSISFLILFFIFTGELDGSSPGIHCRSRRFVAVHIGMRVIDVLFPVAQGQRELVIGDRQTGKSSILAGASLAFTFRNFSVGSRKCILTFFANVGQRISSSTRLFSFLIFNFLNSNSSILVAGVTSAMSAQYLGPLACTTLSEIYRNIGFHNYIGYDDFSKHAIAYRQLCLFLGKPAGREAFPSDIFF